jgi:hypothetical protein
MLNSHKPTDHKRRDAKDPAEAALAVVRTLGVGVFPCASRQLGNTKPKAPLTPNGFHDATSDEAQIREWWSRSPDALIGVRTGATSGFFVLDLDVKDGANGIDELRRLEEAHGQLPPTVHAQTPSGGHHRY